MTNETGDIEPQSPFFSGWRKAVLWLVGAGALAVVGYRGALGTETAPAAPPQQAAAPAIVGESRPAPPAPATPTPTGATVHVPAVAVPGSPPATDPTPQPEGAPAAPRSPAGAGSPAGTGSVAEAAGRGAPAAAPGDHTDRPPQAAAITPDGKVVLNLATETELRKLPGIGKSRARAIVEHRERLGRFRRLEDLLRVKGIGPKRLAALRTKIVLDAP